MKVKNLLVPTIILFLTLVSFRVVHADNGLIYPPSFPTNINQYPPIVPNVNRFSNSKPPYVFGQNSQIPVQQFIPMPNQYVNNGRATNIVPQSLVQRRAPFAPQNFNNSLPNMVNNNIPYTNNNMMPFSNGNNGFNPFSKGNMPFNNSTGGMMPSNPMNNMFGNNNQNFNMPFFNSNSNRKKAWGTKRNIWPDFYTDFTDEAWDTMMSGPRDLGRMPGGWRFPYISTPDPVTVSDAIVNQFPPIAEEAGNMADISDWGIFDNK